MPKRDLREEVAEAKAAGIYMLSNAEVAEAIEQMKVQCDLKYQPEHGVYEMVSARSCLYELGYEEAAEQVIAAIAEAGFEYCLDAHIECSNGDPNKPERSFPDWDVCYWGPDQLKSRLNALWRLPKE